MPREKPDDLLMLVTALAAPRPGSSILQARAQPMSASRACGDW